MDDKCLTMSVADAGRLLGYSRNTAYEAIQRGELPVIKLGRKMRVPRAAIERLLSGAEQC
jgi:excisionase family DNA binding protein